VTSDSMKEILAEIENQCKSLWKMEAPQPEPFLSVYGPEHSMSIIYVLSCLLEDFMREKNGLNELEVLILLGSSWCHDTGYLPIVDKESYDFSNARLYHPSRGSRYIEQNLETFGGRSLGHLIALAVKGHRDVPMKENSYEDRSVTVQEKHYKVRIQFLTSLLRLAEELDIGESRASAVEFGSLSNILKEGKVLFDTLIRYMRNFYVEGVGIYRETDGRLKLSISCQIPFREYEEYLVIPYILQPIQRALIDTIHSLSTENLCIHPQLDVRNSIWRDVPQIPYEIYSRIQSGLLHIQSIRDLIRYDYRRVYKFCGETGEKDSEFLSDTISILNEVEYALLNNSETARYLAGNAVFLKSSQDIFAVSSEPANELIRNTLRFKMHMKWKERSQKTKLVLVPLDAIPLKLEEMSVETLSRALKPYSPSRGKVFGLYELKDRGRYKSLSAYFVYLEPIPSGETAQVKYSWLSTCHPWNNVSTSLRYYSKGLRVSFKSFPHDYKFSLTGNLIKERGERIGEFREPVFDSRFDDEAREYAVDELLAPGSQVVVEWKDSSMSLAKRQDHSPRK
jgi:hypothetical protein